MPGFPFHHQLPELSQTHVQWVGDAIQPSHHLKSPTPPAFNLSQYQGLFQWISSLLSGGQRIGASASVLPMNIQDWFPLELTDLISLLSTGLSRVFSNTTAQKHQFFFIINSAFFMVQFSHPYMTTGKTIHLSRQTVVCKVMLCFLTCCLGWSSEKAMAPHSGTLAWKIPWMEEPGGLRSMGSQRVRHNWTTSLSLFTFMHWRRKWQPTPVFLPGESQRCGSLVGCRLWGHTESDTTEAT